MLTEIVFALRELIARAPAGGAFHDAELTQTKVLHAGFANEQLWFRVTTRGSTFLVTVEEVRSR